MENTSQPNQDPTHTVKFTGDAKTYFGIWSVNIFLSIITLGIYSAWATVRTRQYFYGHTQIDNNRFDYLATPIQILKGRLLAVAFFGIYMLFSTYLPVVAVTFIIAWIFIVPWVINQGLRFNLRMTRHRNVRFAFAGDYKGALINFVLLPIASLFTLYLALPWVLKRIDTYMLSNTSYGGKALSVDLSAKCYYKTALKCFLLALGLIIILSILAAIFGGVIVGFSEQPNPLYFTAIALIINFVLITIVGGAYQAMIRNHIFNNSQFEGVAKLKSDLFVSDYVYVVATNALAIVFTLGLAFPWAKVRKAKLLAGATSVTLFAGADELIDSLQEEQSSFAEEAANVFDVDISLT